MQNLGIDIKVLIAQLINFGLLLFVLRKYLYGPLVKLIDERNKKISEALENSKQIEEKLRNIESKETMLLTKASEKAKKDKEEVMALAEIEKERIIGEAQELAKREVVKGLELIKSAENEAVKSLSDRFMKEIVSDLQAKLLSEAKNKNYPSLRKIIKK